MSTKRNSKRADKNNESGRLLLKKQQISRAALGGVTGGGEVSGLVSGALSIVGSASSSTLETPSGVVSGAASGAASAYDSNHLEDKIKHGIGKGAKATGHAAKKAGSWIKHHISF
jgi:hypothetical protein